MGTDEFYELKHQSAYGLRRLQRQKKSCRTKAQISTETAEEMESGVPMCTMGRTVTVAVRHEHADSGSGLPHM